ncbi:MAG: vitamin B12-dependent ribonucleotide reductase, partial [Chloroflexi bacterium]|nr:vitamin B12-dependent ribonucleotide reductase [Chloroflexota bacterium]
MTLAQKPTTGTHTTPTELGARTRIQRHFTEVGKHPYELIEWEQRNTAITDESGNTFFEQDDVEVPAFWSQTATNVVVSKYFRGPLDGDRESSVKEMIDRVVGTIAGWGWEDDYFETKEEKETFEAELTYIILHQKATFNSPVWFNVGVGDKPPQCSACFILEAGDTMESILEWS